MIDVSNSLTSVDLNCNDDRVSDDDDEPGKVNAWQRFDERTVARTTASMQRNFMFNDASMLGVAWTRKSFTILP